MASEESAKYTRSDVGIRATSQSVVDTYATPRRKFVGHNEGRQGAWTARMRHARTTSAREH